MNQPNNNPKELIQSMLDSGKKYIICWASDFHKNPDEEDQLVAIQEILHHTPDRPFIDEAEAAWEYVTPFNPDTGENITEFVDDKVMMLEKIITHIEEVEEGKHLTQESNNQLYKAGYNDALYHIKIYIEELMEEAQS